MDMLLMLLPMIAIFYFMLIRPENKRKKEAEQLRSAVKNGDKITTIGGIVGTVKLLICPENVQLHTFVCRHSVLHQLLELNNLYDKEVLCSKYGPHVIYS